MSRYIDADALIERILKLTVATDDLYGMGITRGIERAETAIEMQPTADVVEVVRCKDCKHATFYNCKNDACYSGIICEYRIAIGDENFYCSCGERREE